MNNYESIKEVLLFGISIIFIYNILINIFIKIIDYDKNDENLNFKIYILFFRTINCYNSNYIQYS